MKILDLSGQRYGLLVALEIVGRVGNSQALWRCRCDCGNETKVRLGNLRNGHTRSCGCERSTETSKRKTTHGMTGTREYTSWQAMLERCTTPTNHKYKDYGGRGIKVCRRWEKFENFLADMGPRPEGATLGRIENDGDYEPGNCRWETATSQSRNRRNTARYLYNGTLATVTEHCERIGLNPSTVRSRIYTYGWSIEKAFSTQTT